jgi:predicted outer membrane repeat protein
VQDSPGVEIVDSDFHANLDGALVVDGGSGIWGMQVMGSTFDGNTATTGAAVHLNSISGTPTVTFTNCTFSGNSATTFGGAVNVAARNTFVTNNCTFSDNHANLGAPSLLLPSPFPPLFPPLDFSPTIQAIARGLNEANASNIYPFPPSSLFFFPSSLLKFVFRRGNLFGQYWDR